MSWSVCEYCDGIAKLNYGEMWLCQTHGNALTEYAGGLELLLEMFIDSDRDTFARHLSDIILVCQT